MSDSLWPHKLWPTRLLCPWDSPGKNPAVGCHVLLQGVFQIKGSNLGLLLGRRILCCWATRGDLYKLTLNQIIFQKVKATENPPCPNYFITLSLSLLTSSLQWRSAPYAVISHWQLRSAVPGASGNQETYTLEARKRCKPEPFLPPCQTGY